jgi:predicted nucleic acid-binding protein
MFLLDTDIMSALRRRDRHLEAAQWLAAQQTSDLYLSAVTVGEIQRGIVQQEQHSPSFARELTVWLARVLTWYGDRVLVFDVPAAHRWGRLSGALGHDSVDLMIAATALEHGLTVVTRNVGHFKPTGVPVFNPFGNQEATPA